MNQLDALVNARNLISDPAKWTQGAMGRTSDGSELRKEHRLKSQAVCFCALGALIVADVDLKDEFVSRAIYGSMHTSIVFFNDTHTHAEVIEVFDKVIASLKKSLKEE